MSSPNEVDAGILRERGLPDPGDSKKSRGRVMVVGGSRRSPGAVILAGEAALRAGAGRLGLAVPGSVEEHLGVALPEAAVFPLPERAADPLRGTLREEIGRADAVLLGPGFDDADETRGTLAAAAAAGVGLLVLDAYGLGILPSVERSALPSALVLTPNKEELALLLDRDGAELDDLPGAVAEAARRHGATVTCYGLVADADGSLWRVDGGGAGLGTSGSGDVLAGAVAGFAARGLDPAWAAVWGTWAHARAGDRLTARMGLGFLARELAREVAHAVHEAVGPR